MYIDGQKKMIVVLLLLLDWPGDYKNLLLLSRLSLKIDFVGIISSEQIRNEWQI